MTRPLASRSLVPPAVLRLSQLAPLEERDVLALDAAIADSRLMPVRRELLSEGEEIVGPKLIVSGWAARVRHLADGRRQFLSFLLPGDLIGMCSHPRPLAISTVIALTDVAFCNAPDAATSPLLAEAYAISYALEEAYLLSHITRLGRLNAQERIGDFLLELHERMTMAGLVTHSGFDLPLTQETLSDALGLTPVHLNRILQLMRREGAIRWKGGWLTLSDPAALASKADRLPVRVSGRRDSD